MQNEGKKIFTKVWGESLEENKLKLKNKISNSQSSSLECSYSNIFVNGTSLLSYVSHSFF
jgi:hypothetical protein